METLLSPGRQPCMSKTLLENSWERFRKALIVPVQFRGLRREPLL
jgi:hypothetical protein